MALENYNPPTTPWLECVYDSPLYGVYNKPPGLLSVPGRLAEMHDSLVSRVRETHPEAQPVHRLDMLTSGLMVIAYDKEAEKHLKRQFSERTPKKKYEALVYGKLRHQQGKIDQPLICDWPNRPRQIICPNSGKPSQTLFRLLSYEGVFSRLELTPITGRSHQLRVHMQYLQHPILGDEFYAHEQAFAAAKRLCLHAKLLTLTDPETLQEKTFTSDVEF